MPFLLQCHRCRHFAWAAIDSERCGAYPDGIPDPIWLGEVDHLSAYPGDGGVHREPLEPRARDLALRHEMWKERAVDRIDHAKDPLGAIVMAVDRAEPPVDDPTLGAAWNATHDAPAMLLVLLRAGRNAELARAIHLAGEQLAVEGCDYGNDKGWLGVGLTLGSFASEAALTNASAAWAALTSPFRDGYVTARTQLTLLRSIRRVVPAPPPVAEWAPGAGEAAAALGALDDAVVALHLTPAKKGLTFDEVSLLEPWARVINAQGLEDELARELMPGHRLYGRTTLRALARRSDGDDILFADDTLVAVVHLTWSKETNPAFPSAELYPSLDLWVKLGMNEDHDQLVGHDPRVFALELHSPLMIDEILAKLPDAARWKWAMRDSHWYGDYVEGRDDVTRIRIYVEDEPRRFTIQADIVTRDAPAEGWFAQARAVVMDLLLPAIEATDVLPTTPEVD